MERQMKSVFLPALLCVLRDGGGGGAKGGSSGDSGDSGKGGKYDACAQANMYNEEVPASVAAALAMYRSESCFADWNEPPTLAVSAPCPMMRRAASAVRDAERKMLRLPSGL